MVGQCGKLFPIIMYVSCPALDWSAPVPGHDAQGSVWLSRFPGGSPAGAGSGEDGQCGEDEKTLRTGSLCHPCHSPGIHTIKYYDHYCTSTLSTAIQDIFIWEHHVQLAFIFYLCSLGLLKNFYTKQDTLYSRTFDDFALNKTWELLQYKQDVYGIYYKSMTMHSLHM